jgi:WD40 repeat protein
MSDVRNCPSRETLTSFLLGKLPQQQEEAITHHVETCAACEAEAQALDQESDPLIDALRRPPSNPPSPQPLNTPAAPASVPFHLPGYRILKEIGRGGMGVVYQAYQESLRRPVAIKMILTGGLAGAEERLRFLLEGELLARLNHPNFVQVYEVGTVELTPGTVQPYLVMEYVDGGSLKGRTEGTAAPREKARQVLVLARAMEAAHAQGIIHRDLKPANVLIAQDGTLKITDFGLAKELHYNPSMTPAGAPLGTPSYMAPEQATGNSTAIGPAADVYALGAIFYELLTGRPPFAGELVGVLLQITVNPPVAPRRLRPSIPSDLETICLKCLEKEPRTRYATAGELANDLERWLEGLPIQARPAGLFERAWKWGRRHPQSAALLVFLVLSLAVGSAVSTYFGVSAIRREQETRQALTNEEAARKRMEQANEAERWERYLAEIAAASSSLQLHNVDPARQALEGAPAIYRNWEWRHFHSQLDGARTVFRGHESDVWEARFTPDGKRLASCSADRSVRIWDTTTGREIMLLRADSGFLQTVRFSPDGNNLATGGDRLRMWDPRSGALRWEAAIGKETAPCLEWSPDGRRLAGIATDNRLHVWNAATGRQIFEKPGVDGGGAMAVSPDGRHIAASLPDHTVRLWDLKTGEESLVLRGAVSGISTIAFSPDSRHIAAGTQYPQNAVLLWNAVTGERLAEGKGHRNKVTVLAYSPDGRRFASGCMDQTVRLWDGETGKALGELRGHAGLVNDLAFSRDGARLVSASADQTLRLWDVADVQLIAVLHGHIGDVHTVQYSHDGAHLASASYDHTVRLWDAELVARNGVLRGHESYVYDVAFRPDGAEVASAAWDGTVRLWDPTTGRQTGVLSHETSILTALAYSPDGTQLAVVARDKGVWLWDVAEHKEIRHWRMDAGSWKNDTRVAFQPHGTLLAAGSTEGTVRLWDRVTGEEVAALAGHDGCCCDVAFRPDGRQLATAGVDGMVRLWDVSTRKLILVLPGRVHNILRVVYSPNGRLLVAGARDVTKMWDVESATEIAELRPGSPVYGLAFTSDGKRLSCACADNTIRLWDVARQREVAELRGHEAYVHAVMFSPDGTRLVSGSGDFTVHVWDSLSAKDRADRP